MTPARCPTCHAEALLDSPRCWLCGDEQPVLAEAVGEESPFRPPLPAWLEHGSLWLIVVLILLSLFFLLQIEHPYFALAFGIVAVPAVAIAFGGAALSRLLNKPWQPALKIAVGSAVAVVLLPVAAIIALCVACFDALGGFRGGP